MKNIFFSKTASGNTQQGAVAVEFALGLLVFMTLLLGSLQAMTYGYQLSMAGLATEQGARAAALCSSRDSASTSAMQARAVSVMQDYLPGLNSADITIALSPSGCGPSTACEVVTVSLSSSTGSGFQVSGWAPFSVPMPLPASALRTSRPLEMPVNATC